MPSLIVMALLLAACSGTRYFADDIQFQNYLTKLHLPQMSVADASAKLTSLGFVCEPRGVDVSCTKSVDQEFGGQSQHVLLSPVAGQNSGVAIKVDLGGVVI